MQKNWGYSQKLKLTQIPHVSEEAHILKLQDKDFQSHLKYTEIFKENQKNSTQTNREYR